MADVHLQQSVKQVHSKKKVIGHLLEGFCGHEGFVKGKTLKRSSEFGTVKQTNCVRCLRKCIENYKELFKSVGIG